MKGGENAIETKSRAWVERAYGARLSKFRIPGRRGAADNLLVLPEKPIVFVEFKDDRDDAEQSAGQRRFQADMETRGQRYWLIDSFEEFRDCVYIYVGNNHARLR